MTPATEEHGPVRVPREVLDGLERIRASGVVNMVNAAGVVEVQGDGAAPDRGVRYREVGRTVHRGKRASLHLT